MGETESNLRDVVEHSLTGISIIQNGRVIYRNPEQQRLLGRLPHLFDLDNSEHIHPEDREKVRSFYERISSGRIKTLDTDFRFYQLDPDGGKSDMKWVYCRATRFTFQEREAILVNLMDLTESKNMERMLLLHSKMESLGRVAAGIAHEIRNPLSGINIYLNTLQRMLERGAEPDKVNNIIREMMSASNRIESVIRRVMDFSKPGEPITVLTDLNPCIEEAVQLTEVILRQQKIRLELDLAPDLPAVRVDPQMIAQVVLNLITNAADALKNRTGEKRIEVASRRKEDRVLVSVSDSGPGVPPGLRDKIFDPFYTTKEGSTGIGLSICQRIVKDHGGALDVGESKWGGAGLSFTIPIAKR